MANLKINSYITSHDFSIMFLAWNKESYDDNRIDEVDKNYPNNIYQVMENDIFFNFMKPEDSIYETAKAVHFSLQVTNEKDVFEEAGKDATRLYEHIIDLDMKNYDFDTFQIAEDYEFASYDSNIIQIDEPSQNEFIKISVYADKKEEATSITINVLY